jgi:hypothetical protein
MEFQGPGERVSWSDFQGVAVGLSHHGAILFQQHFQGKFPRHVETSSEILNSLFGITICILTSTSLQLTGCMLSEDCDETLYQTRGTSSCGA